MDESDKENSTRKSKEDAKAAGQRATIREAAVTMSAGLLWQRDGAGLSSEIEVFFIRHKAPYMQSKGRNVVPQQYSRCGLARSYESIQVALQWIECRVKFAPAKLLTIACKPCKSPASGIGRQSQASSSNHEIARYSLPRPCLELGVNSRPSVNTEQTYVRTIIPCIKASFPHNKQQQKNSQSEKIRLAMLHHSCNLQ